MDIFSNNKNHACFIHKLTEVDHFKFVSSRCYVPRAMFHAGSSTSGYLLGRIRKVSSHFLFSFFSIFFFVFYFFYCSIWASRVGLAIAMGGGLRLGSS